MAKSSTSFQKGKSGNPGGVSAVAAKAAHELRAALEGDAQEIHAALMSLVRDGNVQAVIYAHQQLVGKPKERVEIEGVAGDSVLIGLSREEILKIAQIEVK